MQHRKLSATVLATTKEGRGSSSAVEKESEIIGIPIQKEKPPRREIRSGALSSHNPRPRCYPELQYIVCRLISSSRGDLKMLAFVFTILVMTAGAPPASEPSWSWLENGKPLQLNRYNQTTQHATEADETVASRTTLTSPARLRVPWLWSSVSTLHPLLEPTRCWNRHAASVRTTHRSAPVFGSIQQHPHAWTRRSQFHTEAARSYCTPFPAAHNRRWTSCLASRCCPPATPSHSPPQAAGRLTGCCHTLASRSLQRPHPLPLAASNGVVVSKF